MATERLTSLIFPSWFSIGPVSMKKILYSILFIFVIFLPKIASAATLSVHAVPAVVGVGKMVEITVLINSNVSVNAFSGALHFSQKSLKPIAVSDGNSIVSMWITHPKITAGAITFAGVTPGGFSGKNGILFKVFFKTTSAHNAQLTLTNVQILRNDGAGTKEKVTFIPIILKISTQSGATFKVPTDTVPPEPFTAILGHSPALFSGKYYLAFSTVDKSSGVDYYEVAETRLPLWLMAPVWKRVTSPYVIHDQNFTSDILIKAVDRAGNERTSIFPRQHLLSSNEWLMLGGIIFLLGVVLWRRYRIGNSS